jgi:hypothetical protein
MMNAYYSYLLNFATCRFINGYHYKKMYIAVMLYKHYNTRKIGTHRHSKHL